MSNEWEEVAPDFAPAWNFESDATVIGTLLGRREALLDDPTDEDPDNKRPAMVYDVALDGAFASERADLVTSYGLDPDQPRVSVWGSWAIDSKLGDVVNGSRIKIVYRGKENIGGGQTVKRFAVYVSTADAAERDVAPTANDVTDPATRVHESPSE